MRVSDAIDNLNIGEAIVCTCNESYKTVIWRTETRFKYYNFNQSSRDVDDYFTDKAGILKKFGRRKVIE